MIFSGSVIESTTLPITLILSNTNYQLVIVVDSISFQLPITQLPISVVDLAGRLLVWQVAAVRGRGRGRVHRLLGGHGGLVERVSSGARRGWARAFRSLGWLTVVLVDTVKSKRGDNEWMQDGDVMVPINFLRELIFDHLI